MAERTQTDKLPPLQKRLFAFLVDAVIVAVLVLIPKVGWIFGLIYFLGKDAMPSLKGQSVGKKLFNIRILTTGTNEPLYLHPRRSVTRGLILLIPVVNVIDILRLMVKGERLADKWTETHVVEESAK